MTFLGQPVTFYIIFGGLFILLFGFTALSIWASKADTKK